MRTHAYAAAHLAADRWTAWQLGVVAELREALNGEIATLTIEDIDWGAWRPLYDEGRSPRSAVDRALVRDF